MTRPRPGIGSELLPVVMILLCLAGTWSLVVTMHHRGASARAVRPAPPPVPRVEAPAGVVALPPPPEPPPAAPEPPPPPPIDPTDQALARLMIAQTEQIVEAQAADRKAEALEAARRTAVAEKERAKRREALVRTQVDALTDQAKRLEAELDAAALERDVLAKERDAAKAALAKARARSSYAVLPHKGPNGTWRRPVIIECHNGEAILQPNGPTFSLLDLSMLLGPRSSPLVSAVARELVRSQAVTTPDGAPVVPYIFFVIRPDGIKPYYSARAQLEPLGVSFGYDLVDQNMEIDFPDLDNLDEWDSPITPRPGRPGTSPPLASGTGDKPWPGAQPRAAGARGSDDSPDVFVWPSRPGFDGNGSGGGIPNGGGNGGGYGSGTAGDESPGLPGLSRGGRTGADSPGGGALARGPHPAARNGLGRGGSGVDPLPLGGPGLDSDNPYDNVGAGSPTTGSRRSGGPPPLGLASGPPGGWAGDGTSESTGTAPPPSGGPRLIPVSPGGLPGLEDPSAAARGSGRAPSTPGAGGWVAADPNQSLPPSGGRASGSVAGNVNLDPTQRSESSPPEAPGGGGGGANPSNQPSPPFGGSFNPGLGSPPPLSQLARLAGATGEPGSGGQPSASKPQAASGLGIPLPMPSQNGQPSGSGDGQDSGQPDSQDGIHLPGARSRSDLKKPMKIDVPFEIVVACGPEGVVIHPGGYRLSAKALKGTDGLLLRDLKTIVQTRRQVDPTIHPIPSIRFLIEAGGGETYRDARRQTMLSGLEWPVAIQVSDSDILDNLSPKGPF